MGIDTHTYKFWEKEVVENPSEGEDPVNYNPLDKRYYFLRMSEVFNSVTMISTGLSQTGTSAKYYRESYAGLSFTDIIQTYYLTMQSILDRFISVIAEMWLKDVDIIHFDFRKVYYIEQLSNYFIVNKINNYIPGKPTQVELIRVLYSEPPAITTPIQITNYVVDGLQVTIDYILNAEIDTFIFEVSTDGGVTWSGTIAFYIPSPIVLNVDGPGVYYFRLKFQESYSNIITVTVI